MDNTFDKPFLTYNQQIDKLVNEKKLIIQDKNHAIELLKKYSYFDLISGYKNPFKDKNGYYKAHASIDDIYALYRFDDKLRSIFLRHILLVEKNMKSLISYSFCEKNGEEQTGYLNVTNYNYNVQTQNEINKLVSKFKDILDNPKEYPYICHQLQKHNNVPLWVLTKALPLGVISKLYSLLKPEIQSKVAHEFQYVNEGTLVMMLNLLARVRNVCAHNERLYDYRFKKGSIDDTDIHKILLLPQKNGLYKKGKNDLFAVVIVLKYLLDEDVFKELIDSLEEIINDLLNTTKIIDRNQLYKYMGFPNNWKEIRNCEKHQEPLKEL